MAEGSRDSLSTCAGYWLKVDEYRELDGSAFSVAAVGAPAAIAGSGNPSGTGPPSQERQALEPGNVLPSAGAGQSPGSVFNEPGVNGSAGGTGGAAYNAAGAPAKYDVACYHTQFKL
jgi:hypothetical protein